MCIRDSGYPADYLEMHYHCPDCQDTGYIGQEKCHCFRQAVIDLLYTQSNIRDILEEENFDHFSFRYYSDTAVSPTTGLSSLVTMKKLVAESMDCLLYTSIEYLVEYCVSKGNKSCHYMEKVALGWAEEGITSVQEAKNSTNLYHKKYYSVLNAFGIKGRGPARTEKEYIDRWTDTFHFTVEIGAVFQMCIRERRYPA